MNYLSPKGLLNAGLRKGQDENAPLYSMHYMQLFNNGESYKLMISMANHIYACHIKDGLYHQKTNLTGGKDDNMSPDQLISYVAYFNIANLVDHKRNVWKWLYTHWFTYDNISQGTNFKRMMQPGCSSFIGASACKYKLARGFWRVILSGACVFSCFAKERDTSGKLKSLQMMNSLDMKWTKWVCTKLVKNWNTVFSIYFKLTDHPLHKPYKEEV